MEGQEQRDRKIGPVTNGHGEGWRLGGTGTGTEGLIKDRETQIVTLGHGQGVRQRDKDTITGTGMRDRNSYRD